MRAEGRRVREGIGYNATAQLAPVGRPAYQPNQLKRAHPATLLVPTTPAAASLDPQYIILSPSKYTTHVMTQNSVVCKICTGATVKVLAANQAAALYMPCPASRRSNRRSLSQVTVAV